MGGKGSAAANADAAGTGGDGGALAASLTMPGAAAVAASATAKAAIDAVAARSAAGSTNAFPPGACGLDSWANTFLRHVDADMSTGRWSEGVKLADGSEATCRTIVGTNGCPMAEALARPSQGNIDLPRWGV